MTDPIPRPRRPRVWRALGCAGVIAFIALGCLGFFVLREMAIAGACGECPAECPPDEPTPVPRVSLGEPRGGVQQLALGGTQSCALSSAKELLCWGWADVKVGTEPPLQVAEKARHGAIPHVVPVVGEVRLVAQNAFALCTIDRDQLLRCGRAVRHNPRTLATEYEHWIELSHTTSVSIGDQGACAIRDDGGAYCWGASELGGSADVPQLVQASVQRLALGDHHACALVGKPGHTHLRCWGENADNQLGFWSTPPAKAARAKARVDDTSFRELAAGSAHTCALAQDGAVWCWGLGLAYQTGSLLSAPSRVQGLPPIAQIAADGATSCARSRTGDVYCWGAFGCDRWSGTASQCGARGIRWVSSNTSAIDMAVGRGHVCVLLGNHEVQCGGDDAMNQLGAVLPYLEGGPAYRCGNKTWYQNDSTTELLPVVW